MVAAKFLPKDVADAFVRQYYTILDGCPENLHRFYQESSLLGWPEPDGNVSPVTTATGISNKILASDHIKGLIDVKTVDAQNSIDGALIVLVTGSMTLLDLKKNFSHTFFLAKQTKGFYVLNDILRYFDVSGMTKASDTYCAGRSDQAGLSSVSSTGKNNQPDSLSATADAAENHPPVTPSKVDSPCKDSRAASPAKQKSDTKAAVESGKAKEVVPAKATAAINAATPSADSGKTPTPVAAPLVNINTKISYASIVAKDVPVLPPPNAQKQTKPSPPAPALKTTALSAAAKEPAAASGKGNGATSAGANGEGVKHIYIGRLPYEITKQEIVNVVTQFGAVRRGTDSVQIKRHEDGFCCSFVEFESADAARRAVEAHHVQFGDRDSSYIAYKRSSRGNDGGSRSPLRGRNCSRGQEIEPARKGRPQNGARRGAGWSTGRVW